MLADVVTDLQKCVADPFGCGGFTNFAAHAGTFDKVMADTSVGSAATSRQILELLTQALKAAPGGCSTGGGAPDNPFCAAPEATLAPFRAQAQFNPDVAAVALVDVINTWAHSNDFDLQRAATPGGFFSQAFTLLSDLTPKTQPATQARVILALQDLSSVQSVADLAASATAALQQIAAQQQAIKQQQQAQQTTTQQQIQFLQQQAQSTRDKKILVAAVVGAVVLGGGAFLLGRWASKSGRRLRHA